MKIKKLGDDLFKVRLPWFAWNLGKSLTDALLEIQGQGKVITAIYSLPNPVKYIYLICTTNK